MAIHDGPRSGPCVGRLPPRCSSQHCCLLRRYRAIHAAFVVLQIKALGWVHAVYFTATARREAKAWMRSSAVVDSSTGSRRALAVYRAMMLGWALSIGINQLQNKGPVIFAFFTVVRR